jgi:hypothetical protein
MAVYYEAGNQSDQGEAAVAQVVLNRLRHPLFPKTVCGVVFEGSALPTGCQFTFTCDGSLRRRPDTVLWNRAKRIAERALDGYVEPIVGEATHYHAIYVVPYWESGLIKVVQIGSHVFYRWPGPLGMPATFQDNYAGLEAPPPAVDIAYERAIAPAKAADPMLAETVIAALPQPVTTPILTIPPEATNLVSRPLSAQNIDPPTKTGMLAETVSHPRLAIPSW